MHISDIIKKLKNKELSYRIGANKYVSFSSKWSEKIH